MILINLKSDKKHFYAQWKFLLLNLIKETHLDISKTKNTKISFRFSIH